MTTNNITVRPATILNANDLSQLAFSLSDFYLASPNTQLPQWLADSFNEEQFLSRLKDDDYTHFVADIDNTIVGFIAIKSPNHLYHLFVNKNHHGKGIGKQLWEYAFEQLNLDTQAYIIVRASLYAVPIYEKFGFVATGTIMQKDGVNFLAMKKQNLQNNPMSPHKKP